MAFILYTSNDSGAPTLNGLTGSLLNVLDAVLVNGYTAHPAGAGWSKPLPNTASYGMYLQGSGSASGSYFLSDMGSGSAAGAEAILTGWDSITGIFGGAVTGSSQYPNITQSAIGLGGVCVRKSVVPNVTARQWVIFADSKTCYGFILTGDTSNVYYAFGFGDFYSIRSGSVDTSRTMIMGRNASSSSAAANERMDVLGSTLTAGVTGNYTSHLYSGLGTSSLMGKHGDGIKGSTTLLLGSVPYLNAQDNGLYISPVWITDSSTGTIKGRLRGFYQFCHAISNISDGQIFTGSLDFPNRTFQVVKQSVNAGVYFLETSDTLETNIP